MSSAALAFSDHGLDVRDANGEFQSDLVEGLRAAPKHLPCKYFYDTRGSELFDRICALPEYYPTRTETALLQAHAPEMAAWIGEGAELIEFGAGSLQKVGILLDAMKAPRAYRPIDISGDYLNQMAVKFQRLHPGVSIEPVVADFTRPLGLVRGGARRAGFFPGSTIGNFSRADALLFLKRASALLHGSGLLIGVDLVKDPGILHAAYNDSQGVTAAFNRNILARANRELGANFNVEAFAHYAFYHPALQRIEMHLVSLEQQRVRVGSQTLWFAEGETIHTENSHKYTLDGFRALASEAGFIPRATWRDTARLFSLHWLEATRS